MSCLTKLINQPFKKRGNTVLFLGAGASRDAGYPLAYNIFTELENHFLKSIINNDPAEWIKFEKSINNKCKKFGIEFKKQNPEIILTLFDLLTVVEKDLLDLANKELRLGINALIKKYFKYLKSEVRHDVDFIKARFSLFLDDFFISKHINDAQRTLPDYLAKMLDDVDSVITTNWDTLPERTLMKASRWFPTDGYGFNVNLVEWFGYQKGKAIAKPFSQPSVPILKLHGSIGWHKSGDTPYLRHDGYLQYLVENTCDENKPDQLIGRNENPIMIYPSYLKQLRDIRILSIWDKAKETIATAEVVTIVGYSLPEADVAVRTLLLPIRCNKATVEIISTATETSDERKRWDEYFKSSGKTPRFTTMTAAERFKNP